VGMLLGAFFLGSALSIPLLGFPSLLRDRRMRGPVLMLAWFLFALAIETWKQPHYFAPATGLLYLLILQSMRHLSHWRWRGRQTGAALIRVIPLICCLMVLIRVAALGGGIRVEIPWPHGNLERARIERRLEQLPGKQLAIVVYGRQHDPNQEWV